jgi:hypothetical protein
VAVALVAVANRLKMQSTLLMRAGFMGVSSVAMFILKKTVTTEITEVSEEKQEDTTNGLIPFSVANCRLRFICPKTPLVFPLSMVTQLISSICANTLL